ncbi:hypothetical protein BP5796_07443 [Coleophoma crateriformis]|uniref:Yeast cell wall synthesis Kre9/Knh1-like N-terminal domain-containing protein n=1 Tax=Coleophoma crateriformis TaxID=565419 RepID=A0A3D8RJI0_9HELO|nr:hypothetical protein BP5796_07443 [Coleophoma crateriformis]
MRYSFLSAAVAALASFASAQTAGFDAISKPTSGQILTAGSPFQIVWAPTAEGTITITLLQGATASTLQLGQTVVANIDNSAGAYVWDVPTSVAGYATYGFQITLDSDPKTLQYSFPFQITGGSSSSSSSSATGSVTSTTTVHLTAAITSSATVTATSSSVSAIVTPAANVTLTDSSPSSNISTTLSKAASTTATKTSTSGGSSSTSSSSAASSSAASGAVGRAATGGFAVLSGLILAFAL